MWISARRRQAGYTTSFLRLVPGGRWSSRLRGTARAKLGLRRPVAAGHSRTRSGYSVDERVGFPATEGPAAASGWPFLRTSSIAPIPAPSGLIGSASSPAAAGRAGKLAAAADLDWPDVELVVPRATLG